MIKVLMLDFNGVTGEWKPEVLAENIERIYGVPKDRAYEIVTEINLEYQQVEQGNMMPKDFHDFLCKEGKRKVPFEKYTETMEGIYVDNPEMVEILRELKGKVKLVSAQNSASFDFDHQSRSLESFNYFEVFFYSSDFGCYKEHPKYFKECIEKLGVKPEEILFFEDGPKNVEAAKSVGIDAQLFTSVEEFKRVIKEKIETFK